MQSMIFVPPLNPSSPRMYLAMAVRPCFRPHVKCFFARKHVRLCDDADRAAGGSPTQLRVSPAKLGDYLLSFLVLVACLPNILDPLVECGLQTSRHRRGSSVTLLALLQFCT